MDKNQPLVRKLDEAQWLRSLRQDETTCAVALAGFNGRFRPPLNWSTDNLVLKQHIVYLFAEHEGRFQTAEIDLVCPRGSCVWVAPGTSFKFSSTSAKRLLVYRFRFDVTQGLHVLVPPRPWYRLEDASSLLETVKVLAQETTTDRTWDTELIRARLLQLSAEFFRKPASKVASCFNEAQRQALQKEVDNHPTARLTAREMAHIVGLSADYFTRSFRRTYGLAPRAWLLRRRLRQAAILLQETTLRVGEIAERLGYDGTYLFSRQFRSEFGLSPRQWRQQNT